MTKRIYETDGECRNFTATVQSCEQVDGGWLVKLDQTAFFPESGGQAADRGKLGNANVLDVQLTPDEDIVHKTDAPLTVGETVTGELDWFLRFTRMQSHAGEHLLCGVVHRNHGYANVGFHMSEAVMTVDFDGPLTAEDIARAEEEANRAVWENVPITVSFPTAEELPNLDYRSKLDLTEGVRLVTMEGYDCCACCAPHPQRTGEIGLIKVLDFCPHKKGTRLEMVAGYHAFCDYQNLHRSTKSVMKLLSATRDGVAEAVEKQHSLLSAARDESNRLSARLTYADLKPIQAGTAVCAFADDASYDSLIYCANALAEEGSPISFLFSRTEGDDYIYVVSSPAQDVRDRVKEMNAKFNGKGGGRPNYAQGKLTAPSTEELINWITNK